ncbi:MAG TPA: glycosyltransferase family 4 protein [Chitinophagaceae bacterium]|jgi:glycosyltransferase involved in cell wall biosynthesis|nr:glycosyltransferase family 4 protein [Chitinophagaceae bacterium]
MRVLWLTNTPVGASGVLNIKGHAGGWMSSLEKHIKNVEGVELAVCFFYNKQDKFKFTHNLVTYYPVKDKNARLISKIRNRFFNRLSDRNRAGLQKVILDFKPDIIQLFGTESGLGEIIIDTEVPVIVHIQGLINPILAAWFPKGIAQSTVLLNSPVLSILSNKGFFGYYYLLKKTAKREEAIIKSAQYFLGRTEWDKRVVKLYNTQCTYFHCDELLRPVFFKNRWVLKKNPVLKIITCFNPVIYKGIEIVLETAVILRRLTHLKFEWSIIGVTEKNDLVRLVEKVKKSTFRENNVFFKGFKLEDELVNELLNSHVFIHPSHIDNSPNSVCEAMLIGMPVIAGNVGGVPSLMEHNVSGILYNSYDPYELAGIILEKAKNPEELRALGENARETALKRHDPDTIVSTIVHAYDMVTKSVKEPEIFTSQ